MSRSIEETGNEMITLLNSLVDMNPKPFNKSFRKEIYDFNKNNKLLFKNEEDNEISFLVLKEDNTINYQYWIPTEAYYENIQDIEITTKKNLMEYLAIFSKNPFDENYIELELTEEEYNLYDKRSPLLHLLYSFREHNIPLYSGECTDKYYLIFVKNNSREIIDFEYIKKEISL